MKIISGIVTYNPDLARLEENVSAIAPQVDTVLLVDNASSNIEEINKNFGERVVIIENPENKGIAYALNQIFKYAADCNYDWVLTLDQDSVCYEDIIEHYLKYLYLPDVGNLCCVVKDRENAEYYETILPNGEYKVVEKWITSGSFCSVEAYKKTKGFDERLFIDWVDHEYCFQLRTNGYKIYLLRYIGIIHELGNSKTVKLFGIKENITNHSPLRRYYYGRNQIFVARKYPEMMSVRARLKVIVHESLRILFFEKKRFAKIHQLWKGVVDGFHMSLED